MREMQQEEENGKSQARRKVSTLNMKHKPMIKAKTQKEGPAIPLKTGSLTRREAEPLQEEVEQADPEQTVRRGRRRLRVRAGAQHPQAPQ
ncbi:MAG: hypothetical protein AAFP18_18755, partial [Bacteroidota bacterium]